MKAGVQATFYQCILLLTKFAKVENFTQERRGPSYLTTTESEDAMSLRQCTLLPTKFANVIYFTQSEGLIYLSTKESEDAMSLRQCILLPTKCANVKNFKQEHRGSSTESEDASL